MAGYIYKHGVMGAIYETCRDCSGVMIYIPSFIKIGPGFRKLIREVMYKNTQEHSSVTA